MDHKSVDLEFTWPMLVVQRSKTKGEGKDETVKSQSGKACNVVFLEVFIYRWDKGEDFETAFISRKMPPVVN